MKKLTTAVVTALVATAGLVATTAPASASSTGFDVSRGADAVTYAGCHEHAAAYSVPANIDSNYEWVMEVVTYDPSGAEVDRKSLTAVNGPLYVDNAPASGNVGILICSTGPKGSYRVESKLDYYNSLGFHYYDYDTDTFEVRSPTSRTGLKVNDATAAYGQTLHFTASSAKERPSGLVANAGAKVRLEKYVGGAWRVIATKSTDRYGKARFAVTWKHRATVKTRAVTVATSGYGKSASAQRAIY
ncbi:hypothetical protein [Nocardioides cavernaquae]|uniref:Uncharacterized protein n=1 Tax=Nocardioides cavernaquae TaxID=2321396 RepID=A0A3A5H7P7_9ACTN|nr:hypothetical protein [Nocardioides cavernaquae]RJS46472.1 hypothetical protein D4739_09790 [Nocardioides cavernaquae]